MLSCATNRSVESLVPDYEGKMYGHLKTDVADAVVSFIEPLQQRYHELRDDRTQLNDIMRAGAEQASERATMTLEKVYQAVGFIPKP
jgi:tryptophanyl-tRNA synthetase